MKQRSVANIVLIEDNPEDIQLFTEVLTRISSNVFLTTIQDGTTALKMLGAGECLADLILLNVDLPDISGTELLAKFRRLPILAQTPVVILSAEDEQSITSACQKLSIMQIIQKGETSAALECEMRRCLHRFIAA